MSEIRKRKPFYDSEAINRDVPIERVLSDFAGVTLNRYGKGLCFSHNDTKPSLSVPKGKNYCHCFVCNDVSSSRGGKTWFPIGVVMETQNLSFPEACQTLIDTYGLRLEDYSNIKEIEKEDAKPDYERFPLSYKEEKFMGYITDIRDTYDQYKVPDGFDFDEIYAYLNPDLTLEEIKKYHSWLDVWVATKAKMPKNYQELIFEVDALPREEQDALYKRVDYIKTELDETNKELKAFLQKEYERTGVMSLKREWNDTETKSDKVALCDMILSHVKERKNGDNYLSYKYYSNTMKSIESMYSPQDFRLGEHFFYKGASEYDNMSNFGNRAVTLACVYESWLEAKSQVNDLEMYAMYDTIEDKVTETREGLMNEIAKEKLAAMKQAKQERQQKNKGEDR